MFDVVWFAVFESYIEKYFNFFRHPSRNGGPTFFSDIHCDAGKIEIFFL